MAGDRGVSFPIAALSVVALFLSTTFLGQHAYDLMRLGESDTDKRLQRSQPPVEARLWEDPFSALNRYRAKLKELCAGDVGPNGVRRADPRCARGEESDADFRQHFKDGAENLTVIAAMLPGAAFIGVEEARRRVRYAVLAGLNAEGFVPEDSEHMGLLYVRPCEKLYGCDVEIGDFMGSNNAPPQTWDAALKALMGNRHLLKQALAPPPPRMDILYETLSSRGGTAGQRRRVVVLWIDDTAVPPRWLSALAILLADVVSEKARLRVIGPFKSDGLVSALVDDLPFLGDDMAKAAGKSMQALELFDKNRATLARLRLINPYSTAPFGQLRWATAGLKTLSECTEGAGGKEGAAVKDCVADAFKQRLEPLVVPAGPAPFFVRTIGTDDTLIKLLVDELCVRGLADDAGGRIILLNEWDSIYARSFAWALRHSLPCPKANRDSHLRLENYPYLRGLDGANTDGAARQVRLVPRGDKSKDDKQPSIEWPESRDQRDYVRRLVEQIQLEADRGGPGEQVRAIGVIGTDVNDKLLLVQALRGAFSDRVLFTTDMDARLLHPEAVRYTRNLVVASSLPLVLDDDKVLKAGVGPFRDVYQTAAFLGARYASADDEKAKHLLAAIETQLANPRLYEIGRDSAVELGTEKRPAQEQDRRTGYALLTGVVLLVLGGFMLGRPAPAMRAALPWNNGSAAPFELSTAIVAGLEAGAWGFALGVVIDLGLPDHMGPARAWLLALAFMLLFWALVYPGLRFPPAARADVYVAPLPDWRRRQLALRLLLIVLPLCFVWFELVPEADGMREPFAPASGVSAWPSQLLRTLGVVLFAWFLDYAWGRSADTARRIGADYFPLDSPPSAAPPPMPLSQRVVDAIALLSAWAHDRFRRARSDWRGFAGHRLRRLATVLAEDSIWFWRPQAVHEGSLDGARVWAEYRRQLLNGPRLGRMLLWLAVAVLFLWVESKLVGGGQPEVPARGLDDRALFSSTILAHVLGTIILLVLVADATVLTWRFIGILKGGRTIYPRSTVERFAAELGPELQAVAAEPITANIDARTSTRGGPAALNSLLDDWIDARLLAQHTAAIGPLIVFPFILVGLLVVARSQLFDNWAISGAVLAGLVCFVLWSIAMAALLNFGAEIARRRAIERMEEDLLWLQGRGDKYKPLAERFPTLIDKVRKLRQGAFAPFFEQPLVQAILVPLGGAGGVQLIEMFMFARS